MILLTYELTFNEDITVQYFHSKLFIQMFQYFFSSIVNYSKCTVTIYY